MKKMLLILALVLMLTPAAFAEDAPALEASTDAAATAAVNTDAPAQEEAKSVAPQTPDSAVDVLPVTAIEIATEEAAAGYSCPPTTIYCRRDSQCDSFCGGAGAGACENGCCACAF